MIDAFLDLFTKDHEAKNDQNVIKDKKKDDLKENEKGNINKI